MVIIPTKTTLSTLFYGRSVLLYAGLLAHTSRSHQLRWHWILKSHRNWAYSPQPTTPCLSSDHFLDHTGACSISGRIPAFPALSRCIAMRLHLRPYHPTLSAWAAKGLPIQVLRLQQIWCRRVRILRTGALLIQSNSVNLKYHRQFNIKRYSIVFCQRA